MMGSELLLSASAWLLVHVVRALPALIWSIRCRPSSRAYRCPPLFASQAQRREHPGVRPRNSTARRRIQPDRPDRAQPPVR